VHPCHVDWFRQPRQQTPRARLTKAGTGERWKISCSLESYSLPAAARLNCGALTISFPNEASFLGQGMWGSIGSPAGTLGGYVVQPAKADGLRGVCQINGGTGLIWLATSGW
jgi:hypothetical protein